MPAGLGGGGYVIVAVETAMGTYVEPDAVGAIAVPITEESFTHNEEKYFSPQIRQQTIVSDVKSSYYHIEGDITMEVDPKFLPYFLHASRHAIAFAGGVYTYTPGSHGSAAVVAGGTGRKTLSITIVRNEIGFGYFGCVVGGYQFRMDTDTGVVMVTFNMLGLGEIEPTTLGTPTWVDPNLYGADSSVLFLDASGTAPVFATQNVDHNGFEFNANFNASAQNRIRPDRAASYIAFGETEARYETELDFLSRADFDNYKDTTTRALRFLSVHPSSATPTLAAATDGVEIDINRTAYENYTVDLGSMGDLIMAEVTGRAIGIAGGSAYRIRVKTSTTIS
jgi:hypothetical protein